SAFSSEILLSCNLGGDVNTNDSAYSDSIQKDARVMSKRIFYLLHAIENDQEITNILSDDVVFSKMIEANRKAMQKAANDCMEMDCLEKSLILSDSTNQKIIHRLSILFHNNKDEFTTFINRQIRPSHAFIQSEHLSDSALFI